MANTHHFLFKAIFCSHAATRFARYLYHYVIPHLLPSHMRWQLMAVFNCIFVSKAPQMPKTLTSAHMHCIFAKKIKRQRYSVHSLNYMGWLQVNKGRVIKSTLTHFTYDIWWYLHHYVFSLFYRKLFSIVLAGCNCILTYKTLDAQNF